MTRPLDFVVADDKFGAIMPVYMAVPTPAMTAIPNSHEMVVVRSPFWSTSISCALTGITLLADALTLAFTLALKASMMQ